MIIILKKLIDIKNKYKDILEEQIVSFAIILNSNCTNELRKLLFELISELIKETNICNVFDIFINDFNKSKVKERMELFYKFLTVGILGSLTTTFNYDYANFFLVNYCLNCFNSGIDFSYTYIENLYFYDFKVWYFWNFFSLFDESFNFFFKSYWFFNSSVNTYNLVYSVFLDLFLNNSLFKAINFDEWYKN